MRGSFNDTLSVRYGSTSVSGTPGDIWAVDVSCRKVFQHKVGQYQFPFDLTENWVTLDEARLHGPFSTSPWPGAVFTDYHAADVIVFDSDPEHRYVVCREERLTDVATAPYWRYLLLPLESLDVPPWPPPVSPPPPPSPPGPPVVPPGSECSSAGELPGFGEYTVKTMPDGSTGYYGCVLTFGAAVHVRVIGGTPSDVWVMVGFVNPGYTCCDSPVSGVIAEAGSQCVTLYHPTSEPFTERVCVTVINLSGSGERSVVIEFGDGPCGV